MAILNAILLFDNEYPFLKDKRGQEGTVDMSILCDNDACEDHACECDFAAKCRVYCVIHLFEAARVLTDDRRPKICADWSEAELHELLRGRWEVESGELDVSYEFKDGQLLKQSADNESLIGCYTILSCSEVDSGYIDRSFELVTQTGDKSDWGDSVSMISSASECGDSGSVDPNILSQCHFVARMYGNRQMKVSRRFGPSFFPESCCSMLRRVGDGGDWGKDCVDAAQRCVNEEKITEIPQYCPDLLPIPLDRRLRRTGAKQRLLACIDELDAVRAETDMDVEDCELVFKASDLIPRVITTRQRIEAALEGCGVSEKAFTDEGLASLGLANDEQLMLALQQLRKENDDEVRFS